MRRCLKLCWLCLVVAACAASPVVDFPLDPAVVEPEPEPEEVNGSEPDDEEPDQEPDDAAPQDAASSTASSTAPLASADAGSSTSEVGSRNDAAAAGSQDAGRDAAATRPALPTPPGGLGLGNLSPPRSRACMQSKDCTVSCFPIGFVSCCRSDHICGCSWAPGAYCL